MTGYEVGFADDAVLAGDAERIDRALTELADRELVGSLDAAVHAARAMLAVFRGNVEEAAAETEASGQAFGDIQREDERTFYDIVAGLTNWLRGDFGMAAEQLIGAVAALPGDVVPLRYATLAVGSSGDPSLLAHLEEHIAAIDPQARSKRWHVALRGHTAASRAAMTGHWDQARDAYLHAQRMVAELGFTVMGAIIGLEFEGYLGARFAEAATAGADAEAHLTELGSGEFVRLYRIHFAGTPAPAVGERVAAGAAVESASVETNA
jgi:hypothetical protein